jgi:hypothetical protein
MALVLAGGAQTNTGQADAGFLWTRYPNGTCMRIDTSKFDKIPKITAWMDGYDQAELTRQYFVLQGWIVYNTDPNNPLCRAVTGTSTQGMYGLNPPLPPVTSITAPTGTLIDTAGNVWSFGALKDGANSFILLNGQIAGGSGAGIKLQLSNGKIYTVNSAGNWYVWDGITWIGTAAP